MDRFPSRLVLENVPRVHFYDGGPRCPEDIPFPSVMRALMQYLGEEQYGCRFCGRGPGCLTNCGYAFFVGVSGVASFLNWKPGWDMDNVEIMYMSDDPAAPFRRVFDAVGYSSKVYGPQHDMELLRRKIVQSIQRGMPVLAFGPVGPPESSLVTGYDEGGDVLIGWSFFQGMPPFSAGLEYEPSGEYRKRDWFGYEPGFSIIVVGEKCEPLPPKDTLIGSLKWMLQVGRTPVTFGNRSNGLAAYDAWAGHLLSDANFPADDAVLVQRHEVHNNVVGFLAEARWYGSQFLAGLGERADKEIHRDAIEDLLHAAALYAGEHQLMWNVWDLAGGIGNPEAWRRLADPAVRRRMAPVIQEAKRKEERALGHIEQALHAMR